MTSMGINSLTDTHTHTYSHSNDDETSPTGPVVTNTELLGPTLVKYIQHKHAVLCFSRKKLPVIDYCYDIG